MFRLPMPEDWEDFEKLCVDVIQHRRRPMVPPERHGTSGTAQLGVDFWIQMSDGIHAFQCKHVLKFTFDQFKAEVGEAEKCDAMLKGKGAAGLRSYTVMTTTRNVAELQRDVAVLLSNRVADKRFPVHLICWAQIEDWIKSDLKLMKRYFGPFLPDAQAQEQAIARALDREFPGTTITKTVSPGRTDVVFNPGPGGIKFSGTFLSGEAFEEFRQARLDGRQATFSDSDLNMVFPTSVREVVGFDEGDATVAFTPVTRDQEWRGKLLLGLKGQELPTGQTAIELTELAEAFDCLATLSWEKGHLAKVSTRLRDIPILLLVTVERNGDLRVEWKPEVIGRPVAEAAEALRVAHRLMEGPWFALVDRDVLIRRQLHAQPVTGAPREGADYIEVLASLARVTGWPLEIPKAREDLSSIGHLKKLLSLYENDRVERWFPEPQISVKVSPTSPRVWAEMNGKVSEDQDFQVKLPSEATRVCGVACTVPEAIFSFHGLRLVVDQTELTAARETGADVTVQLVPGTDYRASWLPIESRESSPQKADGSEPG